MTPPVFFTTKGAALCLMLAAVLAVCAISAPEADDIVPETSLEQSLATRATSTDVIEAICGLRAYCLLAHDAADGMSKGNSLVELIKVFGKEAAKPKLASKKIQGVKIYVGEAKHNYNVVKDYGESLFRIKEKFDHGLGKYFIESLESAIKSADNGKFSVLTRNFGTGRARHNQRLVVLDHKKLGLVDLPKYFTQVLGVKHGEFNEAYNLCTYSVDLAGVGGVLKRAWGAGERLKEERKKYKKRLAKRQERRIKAYHRGLYKDALERIKFSARFYMRRKDPMQRVNRLSRDAKPKKGDVAALKIGSGKVIDAASKDLANNNIQAHVKGLTTNKVVQGLAAGQD